MFGWLRRLFRRKPAGENVAEVSAGAEAMQTTETREQVVEEKQKASEQRLAPHSAHEPDRPEKICPKCGSPNDKFVHICWMCKAEI